LSGPRNTQHTSSARPFLTAIALTSVALGLRIRRAAEATQRRAGTRFAATAEKTPSEDSGPAEGQRNDRVRPRAEVTRLAGSGPSTPGESNQRAAKHPRGTPMAPVTTEAKRKTADGGKAVAGPLSAEELRKMDAYFRALNYLSVGQIYLLDNPLLKEPLK